MLFHVTLVQQKVNPDVCGLGPRHETVIYCLVSGDLEFRDMEFRDTGFREQLHLWHLWVVVTKTRALSGRGNHST